MSRRRQKAKRYTFYNEMTEPMLPMITTPIPRYLLPRTSKARRARSRIGAFFAAIIGFINALLALDAAAVDALEDAILALDRQPDVSAALAPLTAVKVPVAA